jgi:hypothetical protein
MKNMNAAEKPERWISEPMTWEEICARYPDQYVFGVDAVYAHEDAACFQTCRVVGYGSKLHEAWRVASAWEDRYEVFPYYFTGTVEPRGLPRIVMTDEIRELIRVRRGPYPA